MKKVEQSKYHVEYGHRTPAWYTLYADQLHLSESNKL